MILVPEILNILYKFLKEKNYLNNYLPIFIRPLSENVLRNRLLARGDSEEIINKRLVEAKTWEEKIKQTKINFKIITNETDLILAVEKAQNLMR
jgi:guanylate kinase